MTASLVAGHGSATSTSPTLAPSARVAARVFARIAHQWLDMIRGRVARAEDYLMSCLGPALAQRASHITRAIIAIVMFHHNGCESAAWLQENSLENKSMAHQFTTSHLEDSLAIFRQWKKMAEGAIAQVT